MGLLERQQFPVDILILLIGGVHRTQGDTFGIQGRTLFMTKRSHYGAARKRHIH